MGYKVTLRDVRHHQEMKVERIKYKLKSKAKKEKKKHKQEEKKERPRHENFAVFGEWVSEGEESTTSSSDDESSKSFTTWLNIGSSFTPRFCLMAKGVESNVSDSDSDSDSPSMQEYLDLICEQQKAIKKQTKEMKELKALNDLGATLANNYE